MRFRDLSNPSLSIIFAKFNKNSLNLIEFSFVILSMISLFPSNESKNEKLYIAAGLSESNLIYGLQLIYLAPGFVFILGTVIMYLPSS